MFNRNATTGCQERLTTSPLAVTIPALEHDMQEKRAPLSSLDLLYRTSLRSRYNSAFVSKLLKIFESKSKADLSLYISNYNTERLNKLRGTSTFCYYKGSIWKPICLLLGTSTTVLSVLDIKQKPEVIQLCIPELRSDLRIISPLALQVQTLIGFNLLNTLNEFLDSVSVF